MQMDRNLRRRLYLLPRVDEEVEAVAHAMESIPPGDNPFRHDTFSMGSMLARGWMAMHEGNANADNPVALSYLVLVNTHTGQRIHLELQGAEENLNPIVLIDQENDSFDFEPEYVVYCWHTYKDRLKWAEVPTHSRRVRPNMHYVLVGNYMVLAQTFLDSDRFTTALQDSFMEPLSTPDYMNLRAQVEAFYVEWNKPCS